MNVATPSDNLPVALVTGGALRVGAAICEQLHGAGFNIVVHYRKSSAAAQELQDRLTKQRPNSVHLVGGDLKEPAAWELLISQAHGAWRRLDALVNNASTFYPTPVGTITQNQWDDLVGINVKTPLFLSQLAAPHLRQTKGCIINIVDIHGDRPLKNHTVYCLAKAGLISLTKSLARELAPDIRVNGVAPGAVLWPDSPMSETAKQQIIDRTVLKRPGSPSDIARAVRFLVCDAPYVTGQILAVDGGRTLSN